MKTLILAAFVIIIGLASCSVSEPGESVYYPQDRAYNAPYDPYYNPAYDTYSVRRVYDYRTGRYYDVPVYGSSVYGAPVPYQTYRRGYSRDGYRREYNRDAYRREYNTQQPTYTQPSQPRNQDAGEKRLPDGTRISPDGTVTLPNGEVRRRQ